MDGHRNQHPVFASSWIIAVTTKATPCASCANCCPSTCSSPPPPLCREPCSTGTKNLNSLLSVASSFRFRAGAAAVTAALCGAGLYALIINPNRIQRTDLRNFLSALPATVAFHTRIEGTPENIFLFRPINSCSMSSTISAAIWTNC